MPYEMQHIPTDILRVICSYMTLEELNYSHQASRDFHFPKQKRKRRFQWCVRRMKKRPKFKPGYCSDTSCEHRRAILYQIEPELETIVLSNYCSKHTKQYINTDAIHFT